MNTKRQPKLLYLKETPVRSALALYLLIAGLVLLPTDWLGGIFAEEELTVRLLGAAISRAVFFAVMLFLLVELGFKGLLLPDGGRIRALLPAIPCLLIAVNNLPFYELATGKASVTAGAGDILLFAAQCLCVGAFEEISFRGLIFPLLLQRTGDSPKGRTLAVLASSALFGLLHLCNLFGNWGAAGAVLLQVGYSFLLGCMLAVLMWSGTGVLSCIFIHALYNFCGMLVSTLGEGLQWTTFRVVLTVIVSVLVGLYCLYLLIRTDSRVEKQVESRTDSI